MTDYPHTSWNTAERRAQAHSHPGTTITVETLATVCPVEQGRDHCPVCCAVNTDTP